MAEFFETTWPLLVLLIAVIPGIGYIAKSGETRTLSSAKASLIVLALIAVFASTGGMYLYETVKG